MPAISQTASAERPRTMLQAMNIGTGQMVHGGFGAPVYKYSRIGSSDVNFFGARGAWLVNRTYMLGGFMYGLASDITANVGGKSGNLDMQYGGALAGYNFFTNRVIHASLLLQAGAGELKVPQEETQVGLVATESSPTRDRFSVVEPEVLLETNVTRILRVGVGTSYRTVSGVGDRVLSKKDIEGWTGTLAFNIGSF